MQHLVSGEYFSRWLVSYVDLSEDIPSKWTLERVISLIPTAQLHPLFDQFREHAKTLRTIAFDGKTLRGTRSWGQGHHLHLLHAWSVEEGVCLAQIPDRGKVK